MHSAANMIFKTSPIRRVGRFSNGWPASFVAHGYLALLLVGFVVLHFLAALYHQFVLKDRLFRRMWVGRRVSNFSAPPQ
jgi:cytochrome b561